MEITLDQFWAFLLLAVLFLAIWGAADYFVESCKLFKQSLDEWLERNRK